MCLGVAGYGRGWSFAVVIWAALKNREGEREDLDREEMGSGGSRLVGRENGRDPEVDLVWRRGGGILGSWSRVCPNRHVGGLFI